MTNRNIMRLIYSLVGSSVIITLLYTLGGSGALIGLVTYAIFQPLLERKKERGEEDDE